VDDLPEGLFQVADAAPTGEPAGGGAQGGEQVVVLTGVHVGPTFEIAAGTCAPSEGVGCAEQNRSDMGCVLPATSRWVGRHMNHGTVEGTHRATSTPRPGSVRRVDRCARQRTADGLSPPESA